VTERLTDEELEVALRVADPNSEGIHGHCDVQTASAIRLLIAEVCAARAATLTDEERTTLVEIRAEIGEFGMCADEGEDVPMHRDTALAVLDKLITADEPA